MQLFLNIQYLFPISCIRLNLATTGIKKFWLLGILFDDVNSCGVYKGSEVTCDSSLPFPLSVAVFIRARGPITALRGRGVGRWPASGQGLLTGFGLSGVYLPFGALGLETLREISGSRKAWQQGPLSGVTTETYI